MPWRAWVCLCLFCLPTCLCGLAGIDSWPFSSFPMYSVPLAQGHFEDYTLHLVTSEGTSYGVRERGCLWPLDAQRLNDRVKYLLGQPDGAKRLEVLMQYTAQRSQRFYRRHNPMLRPIRLELRRSRGSYFVNEQPALVRRVDQSEVMARVTLAPE